MPNRDENPSIKQLEVLFVYWKFKKKRGRRSEARTFDHNTLTDLNLKVSSANGSIEPRWTQDELMLILSTTFIIDGKCQGKTKHRRSILFWRLLMMLIWQHHHPRGKGLANLLASLEVILRLVGIIKISGILHRHFIARLWPVCAVAGLDNFLLDTHCFEKENRLFWNMNLSLPSSIDRLRAHLAVAVQMNTEKQRKSNKFLYLKWQKIAQEFFFWNAKT